MFLFALRLEALFQGPRAQCGNRDGNQRGVENLPPQHRLCRGGRYMSADAPERQGADRETNVDRTY